MQDNNILPTDLFGQALLDYVNGDYSGDITTYISLDEEDLLSLPYLFRSFDEMPALEQRALQLSVGKVLDVGCGAGSHSLYLQKKGMDITALDVSPGAVATCKKRGLKNVILTDFYDFSGMKFDTILLLMHGIGMAGNIENLDAFLEHLISLLNPGGQVLLDSSDIIYMFDQDKDGGYWVPGDVAYYGEVQFIVEYKEVKSASFPWLYLDYNTLEAVATEKDLTCQLVSSGEHNDYLARLSIG
ncbi:MAG: class I SAM-dependent methyltransferase [Flavobacteriaceae bacterium]